jgi:TonB family protein
MDPRRIAALALLLILPTARADFDHAAKDYAAGRFTQAFDGFLHEAELGNAVAMVNIGVMYWEGLGVQRDRSLGYGWIALAADYEDPKAVEMHKSLAFGRIPPYEAAARSLQNRFGRSALAALAPSDCALAVYDIGPRAIESPRPQYPMGARIDGKVGLALAYFDVMPDGTARNVQVVQSLPPAVFDPAIVDSALRSTFAPAQRDGKPVRMRVRRYFSFALSGGAAGARFEKWFEKLDRESTESPAALYVYAVFSRAPEEESTDSPRPRKEADQPSSGRPLNPDFESDSRVVRAAQGGVVAAQYLLGYGEACPDAPRAMMWLRRAAAGGEPRAQALLTEQLLWRGETPEQAAEARIWLQRASATRDSWALRTLAELLATSSQGDAAQAHQLLDRMPDWNWQDPTVHEIRAAAHARNGDFEKALASEDEAIRRATTYRWDLAPLQARRAAYGSHQAWTQPIDY